jgi:hypothetical protein
VPQPGVSGGAGCILKFSFICAFLFLQLMEENPVRRPARGVGPSCRRSCATLLDAHTASHLTAAVAQGICCGTESSNMLQEDRALPNREKCDQEKAKLMKGHKDAVLQLAVRRYTHACAQTKIPMVRVSY